MRLDEWRERYFLEPRPSLQDLQRNCRNGSLPAEKICRRWYVQVCGQTDLTPKQKTPLTDPQVMGLVNKVLGDNG